MSPGTDTTLKGAVVEGKKVTADVGGDLHIASLQDTSEYDSKQKNMGGSITIGAGGGGSFNYSKSNVNSDYASVTEQSGIKAGDDGFQVKVEGNTDLKGAVIASTDKAVQDDKNILVTASLTTSDIQNKAEYEGKSAGISLGGGSQGGVPNLTGAGIGSDDGHAASVTQSGVSGMAGNKDVRSDDKESGIAKIFDADKVQQEINAQMQITQAFSQQAPKAAKDYATSKLSEADTKLAQANDQSNGLTEVQRVELTSEANALKENWKENGNYRIATNIIIAALSGGEAGAVGAVTKESLSWAADQMRQAVITDSKKFPGIVDSQGNVLSNMSGVSAGVNGDGIKSAGSRLVLSEICDKGRCAPDSSTKSGWKENEKGEVILNPIFDSSGKEMTVREFVDGNPDFRSPLGGVQGGKGQLKLLGIQFDYEAGSLWDHLAEAYGGTHDTLNKPIWYDNLGNGKDLKNSTLGTIGEITNSTNVLLATPFAMATLLPPEVWNAIFIGMKAAK